MELFRGGFPAGFVLVGGRPPALLGPGNGNVNSKVRPTARRGGRIFRGEEMEEVLEARAGAGWRWWSGRSGPALCVTTRCSVRCAGEARL